MNILKNLRKPYLSVFLAFLILHVSCEKYDMNSKLEKTKFDYSLFNTYQGKLLSINLKNTLKKQAELSRLEVNDAILEEINLQLGTYLDYSTDFKSLEINTPKDITNWGLNNDILDSQDVTILNDFIDTTLSNGVEIALTDLEENVLQNELWFIFRQFTG